jgi:hypothetical protein
MSGPSGRLSSPNAAAAAWSTGSELRSRSSTETSNAARNANPSAVSSSRRRVVSASRPASSLICQVGRPASRAAAMRIANGNRPHARTTSAAAAGSAATRCGPTKRPSSSSA